MVANACSRASGTTAWPHPAILGPVAEAQLRRALQIILGDPLVLVQSPMSATLLAMTFLALVHRSC